MYANTLHSRLAGQGLLTLVLAFLLVPVSLAQPPSGHSYKLHQARPSVATPSQDTAEYKVLDTRQVLQGPEYAMAWPERVPAAERTPDNARYPLYRQSMGLFVPAYWADGRPAAQDSGWHGPGFAIHYDSFKTRFTRGKHDRTIAGHQARHYVLTARYVSWAEGDPRKEHDDVTYDVWVLPGLPFSWAPVLTVSPDDRVAVALEEHLRKLGLVARIDKNRRRHMELADGTTTPEQKSVEVAWISDLEPADVPQPALPIISEATLHALRDAGRQDLEATCRTILDGATPGFVERLLDASQRIPFLQQARARCLRHMPQRHAATAEAKGAQSASTSQCTSKDCFEQHFDQCQSARYSSGSAMGGKVEYTIRGKVAAGCQVRMRYVANPNPAWVGKALDMTLDPGTGFAAQVKPALRFCLTHDVPGKYHCQGPLRGLAAAR